MADAPYYRGGFHLEMRGANGEWVPIDFERDWMDALALASGYAGELLSPDLFYRNDLYRLVDASTGEVVC